MSLQIVRAKPNPVGKDRYGSFTPGVQLTAEWVDIRNTGITPLSLNGLILYHKIFNNFCAELGFDPVTRFEIILQSGEVIRVHSGGRIPLEHMHREDALGADYHVFTGGNYIWNNTCGDTAILYNPLSRLEIDRTYYDPHPPEGRILRRIGSKLI